MILGADWDNTIKINHDVRKEDIEVANLTRDYEELNKKTIDKEN